MWRMSSRCAGVPVLALSGLLVDGPLAPESAGLAAAGLRLGCDVPLSYELVVPPCTLRRNAST